MSKPWLGHLTPEKRGELENRITSVIFNMSTGIPSYLAYFGLLYGKIIILFWMFKGVDGAGLRVGQTWLMDVFSVWSIAYIMFDYTMVGM